LKWLSLNKDEMQGDLNGKSLLVHINATNPSMPLTHGRD